MFKWPKLKISFEIWKHFFTINFDLKLLHFRKLTNKLKENEKEKLKKQQKDTG